MTDHFVDPAIVRRALRAPAGRRRAQRAGQAPGPHRPRRGGPRRGPEQEGPGGHQRPHPPEQARALPPPTGRCGRAPTPTSRSPTPRPHHLLGRLVEVVAEPTAHARASRCVAGLSGCAAPPSPSSARPRRASRRVALAARPRAIGGIEIVSVDSMQVYRGMDIGTAKPTPAERAEVPHHLPRPGRPGEEVTVVALPSRGRRRAWPASRRAATGRARRRHRPLPAGRRRRARAARAQWPDVRAELEAEPDTARPARPAAERSIPSPPPGWSRPTAAGSCGPSR